MLDELDDEMLLLDEVDTKENFSLVTITITINITINIDILTPPLTITTGEHEGELHPWEHHYGGKPQPNHDSGFQYLLIIHSSAWIPFLVNNFSVFFLSLHCLV